MLAQLARARSVSRDARPVDDQISRQIAIGAAVAHVAHEFKNALTSIGGFARFIERNPEDASRVREDAAIIARGSDRLEQMVRETLEYSRPNSMKPVVQPLNATVREALEGLRGRVPDGVVIESDLAASVPEVAFDAAHIERVVANLVGNAIEAVGAGGVIRVGTQAIEGGAELRVEDNGPGIPPEIRDRLFEPFFTTKSEGSGLGLAICRQIIAGHGGTIRCEPGRGRGTVFRVILPGADLRDGRTRPTSPTPQRLV